MNPEALRALAAESPAFSAADAVDIAATHYGLRVSASELLSERDRNFHLKAADGGEYVLKIASAAEPAAVTQCQIEVLRHIEAHAPGLPVPRIVPTRDGRNRISVRSHIVRLVTWLPGDPLGRRPPVPELCRNFGRSAAALGHAMSGFEHPGAGQKLLWDMQEAANVRDITQHIPDSRLREKVRACLDRFATAILPAFGELRTQVIHNDLNPDNVLLDADDHTRIAGVIDFGDMVRAPLVVDVAVAASYLRDFNGDPLAPVANFVASYHASRALERREIDIVFDLILVRLATTVSILHWRSNERGEGDSYLDRSVLAESTAGQFFERLWDRPRDNARQTLSQSCASVDVAAEAAGKPSGLRRYRADT